MEMSLANNYCDAVSVSVSGFREQRPAGGGGSGSASSAPPILERPRVLFSITDSDRQK